MNKNENGVHINLRKFKRYKSLFRDPYTHHIYKNKDRYRNLYLGQGILFGGIIVGLAWLISLI